MLVLGIQQECVEPPLTNTSRYPTLRIISPSSNAFVDQIVSCAPKIDHPHVIRYVLISRVDVENTETAV